MLFLRCHPESPETEWGLICQVIGKMTFMLSSFSDCCDIQGFLFFWHQLEETLELNPFALQIRSRKEGELIPGLKVNRWQSWDMNPGLLAQTSVLTPLLYRLVLHTC